MTQRFKQQAVLTVVMLLLFLIPIVPFPQHHFLQAITWAACMITAFAGYGTPVAKFSYRGAPLSLALRAVLGAALLTAIGGAVTMVHQMRPIVGSALVAVGMILFVLHCSTDVSNASMRWLRRVRYAKREPWVFVVAALPAVLYGLAFLGGIAVLRVHKYDDELAYLTYPKQILQTGAFDNAFSLRRLASYGGLSFLQSLVASVTRLEYVGLLDQALFLVLSLALVRRGVRFLRRPAVSISIFVMLLLFFLQNVSLNLASHFSGLCGFLTLFVLLDRRLETTKDLAASSRWTPSRDVLALALIGSALCTYRQNFIPFVCGVLATSLVARAYRQRHWGFLIIDGFLVAALALVFLLPWILQIRASSGAAFFPIQHGNLRDAFGMRSPSMTMREERVFLWDAVTSEEPFSGWFFVFLLLPFLPYARKSVTLQSFAAFSIIAYGILAYSFTLSNADNFARYTFPFVGATLCCALLVWGSTSTPQVSSARLLRQYAAMGIVPAFALIFCLAQTRFEIRRRVDAVVQRSQAQVWRQDIAERYARAEKTIPRGQAAVVMVDEPYQFDFSMHTIHNLDIPGAVSPAPGIPFFKPVAEFEAYFHAQGIHYAVFVRPDASRANYLRPYWLENLFAPEELNSWHAPYYLYILDTFEALARTHKVLFEEANLVVVDLDLLAP
jgi:hypothetical protein